jgi:hypothetical protein
MLFQFDLSGYEWMLGLGIMFGFSFLMTVLTFDSFSSFFIWLTIFSAVVVWAGLLELWVLILCLIILGVVIYLEINDKGVNSG